MTLNNDALRKLRMEAGISQENMAYLMKIEQSTYNRLENGKTKLKIEHIAPIASAVHKSEVEVLSKLSSATLINTNPENVQKNQTAFLSDSDRVLLEQFLVKVSDYLSKAEKIPS